MSEEIVRVIRRRKVSASAFSRVVGSGGDLADEAAAQIRERIDAGHFQSGQRLPSERDLADELGVSRTVLRESLRSLESLGYVQASAGRGTFVADPTDEWQSRRLIDDWLRRNQAALRDLIELRAAIEPQALRGGTGDTRALAAELQPSMDAQARAIADGRPDDAAEIDMSFHVLLTRDSPNQPLRSLALAIIDRARQAAHATYRVRTYNESSLRQHKAIVAALANGDRGHAADLLAEHHLSRSDLVASYLERQDVEPASDELQFRDPIRRMPSRRAPDRGTPDQRPRAATSHERARRTRHEADCRRDPCDVTKDGLGDRGSTRWSVTTATLRVHPGRSPTRSSGPRRSSTPQR